MQVQICILNKKQMKCCQMTVVYNLTKMINRKNDESACNEERILHTNEPITGIGKRQEINQDSIRSFMLKS